TIVELLIVIVIIGILAAITIVAYNGIQNRGKAAAGQSLANSIDKKAEAFNSIDSTYPTHAVLIANTGAGTANNSKEAKLDDTSSVIAATNATTPSIDGTSAADGKKVSYFGCGTGANIWYWDYAASPAAVKKVTAGAGC
ncbi:MAG: hypothetical protein WAZ21_01390, partial [Candidatus Saccharimonadales bacterium]